MHRPKTISLLLLSILLWTTGCDDLAIPKGITFPFNELKLLEISSDKVTFTGEITLNDERTIVSADLNWYPTTREKFREEERFYTPVSIDNNGQFMGVIDRDMLPTVSYTVRVRFEMSDGQILFSNPVRFQNTALVSQPLEILNRYDSFFGRMADSWSADEDGVKIFDLNIAGNFDPSNNEFRESSIVTRRLDNFSFFDSNGSRFWLKQGEQFFFRHPVGGNLESLAVYDRPSDSFTELGNIPAARVGSKAVFIGEEIYYFGADRQVYRFSFDTELSIEQITSEPPVPGAGLVRTYFTSAGENIYLTTQQNNSPSGQGDDEVRLWELNPEIGSWQLLPDFPGSVNGRLWFSGEPGTLMLGGGDERINLVNPGEKNMWILDLNEMNWQMIGWLPFVDAFSNLDPVYFEGKHYFLGSNSLMQVETVIFTIDLRELVDI